MSNVAEQPSPARRFEMDVAEFSLVEESEHAVGAAFYTHNTTLPRPKQDFAGRLSLQRLGPVVVGELDYNSGVLLTCPNITGSYHLNVPVMGSMHSDSRGLDLELTPDHAALYRKDAGVLLKTQEPLHMLAVKLDARALEVALSALLGHPIEVDLKLAADVHLDRGLAKQWWDLLTSVRAQLDRGDVLLQSALVAEPLAQALMTGFLLATDHQFSEELHVDAGHVAPEPVRLAEDVIRERLAEPITIADIAIEIGFSLRAIQRGFIQHRGVTPSEFIRKERLLRAHADLVAADSSKTLVADVAARWGFGHLGRFSVQYKSVFGMSPSETLRL